MKKIFLTLIVLLGSVASAMAITPELYAGYGGYTQMDVTDMHQGGKVNNAWGAVTVGANFKVLPKMWIGPSYTFSSSDYKHSDMNIYYHVIMLNARYEYWRNSIVTLYAHMGVGADISHTTYKDDYSNKGYFAFQLSPIGAQVGVGKNFSLYGELGFGAQGLLQVGVRYTL